MPELHSIYDLTTFCRKTTGDVPAKLVGASTTVVGSKMYLFGGRLVTERRMVADLYVFDLETYNWEKIAPFPEDDVPRARYFHSVDTWNNQLIVFGGMSNEPDSPNPDELCVLNDVRFFDIATRHWLPPSRLPNPRQPHAARPLRAALDFYNTWLDDVCVYDLLAKTWSERRDYPRHCGSYRSVAVSSNQTVRFPKDEMRASAGAAQSLGPPGTRFQPDGGATLGEDITSSESLTHLPYSAAPNDEHPSDIYLYSNYNFTDVKRELELFSPLPDTGFTIQDRSAAMSGTTFPPGLRFPTGAILGTHLIIAGIYLAHSYQSFSIWVLDLTTMVWSRIDPGKAVEAGSWFRGCLWPEANKFMIFGNRNGNLVDDYNRRLLSWDHVAVVDLEAFGIYQPPPLKLDIPMQELGLAALEEGVLADFEIVCEDGRKIACSRRLLEERWPWFKEERGRLLRSAMSAMEALPGANAMHVPLPDLPGRGSSGEERPDPRLTPRAFNLSEPYPITLALLQYFYTLALLTPLQTAPAVLSQLLVLATTYRITHLQTLVRHAMHRALSNSTSVGVYEVATLCSCRSLQIRALKTVMSYTQKKPSRSQRPEKEGGGGGGSNGGGGAVAEREWARWAGRGRGGEVLDAAARDVGCAAQGTSAAIMGPLEEENELYTPDADQLFTLPVFNKQQQQHRNHGRSDSVVSVRTENDINELMELMTPHLARVAPRGPPSPAQRARKTDQMIMDEMYQRLHPYTYHSEFSSDTENDNDNDESSYYPGSSRASAMGSNEESESDADGFESSSARGSPGVIAYTPPAAGAPRPRTSTRAAHLTRNQAIASLSASSSDGRTTPSDARGAPEQRLADEHALAHVHYPVTPPHSPDALPSIEERYTRGEYDDDDDDEFERRIGMHSGVRGRPPVQRTTRDGNPWPTQKSRVEWIPSAKAPAVYVYNREAEAPAQTQAKAESRIVAERREPRNVGGRVYDDDNASDDDAAGARARAVPDALGCGDGVPAREQQHVLGYAQEEDGRLGKGISGFFDPKDSKAAKAEEKRRKKEASKARMEELARSLKERAKKAKDDADKASSKSKERRTEPVTLFGGMSGVTM
ncbi:hypothetical protein B0H14DRAFT_3528800 [Mycena olivaceomarginata]|nr:hypothetical protein B0H14DRAFT_3528800 [Mycena olivaceomarginata]